jgi:UDP-glucose 4-epimerase
MNNTILVTGGLGYIGSHTVVSLIQSGYKVVIVDSVKDPKDILNNITKITGVTPGFYQADFGSPEVMREILIKHSVTDVIHFAAYKSVGESVSNPLKYYKNNVVKTISLLNLLKELNIKNFIFSSSATVYGGTSNPPFKEDSQLSAINPYGETKLICEMILKDLVKSDNTWNVGILRYFNPVGAHESHLIGEPLNTSSTNLMVVINQHIIGKREEVQVFGNDYPTPDGTCLRDYIHVSDLAEGHKALLKFMDSHTGLHIFNLGTGKPVSVLEIIGTYEKVNSTKIKYSIADRREGDAAVSYADVALAKQVLNWDTKKTLKDMCLDSFKWAKTQALS